MIIRRPRSNDVKRSLTLFVILSVIIAGPLYRFEKILTDIGRGDLTQRFKLRDNDQLSELSESITELTTTMDKRVSDIKFRTHELSGLLQDIRTSGHQRLPVHQTVKILKIS